MSPHSDSPGTSTAGPQARTPPSRVPGQPGAGASEAARGGPVQRPMASPGRFGSRLLFAPVTLLVLAMAVLSLLVNRSRLGLDLAGGRLLPARPLGDTWSSYLASWHPVGGGSAAPAPAALAVLGLLGLPVGSPAAAVSLLLLATLPLAALSAYLATRALPVTRGYRALAAAGYAVLPPAVAGVAQGRLDVVLTHLLLPLVLAGTAVVLRGGTRGRGASWLSTAAATALGLGVISAFAPLLHLMVLVVVLVGFIVVPAPQGLTLRRAAGLFGLMLLPLGMLIPWPAVVVQRPAVLLHGVGAVVPEQAPGWLRLLALDPGGDGAASWVGLVVVAAAVIAMVVRPSRAMLPGLGLVLLGAGAAAVLTQLQVPPLTGGDPRPGFTGGALLFAACGLLWIVLLAGRPADRAGSPDAGPPDAGRLGQARSATLMPAALCIGVVVLSAGALVFGARGPLTDDVPAGLPVLAAELTAELDRDGTSVLVVDREGEPVRLTRSRTARFGDDDIAPLRATGSRLDRVAAALRAGEPGETPAAIADMAATGVAFIVLPTAEQGTRALAAAGPLAGSAPPAADGRPVLRVVRPIPGAELLGPALAEQSRNGAAPPIEKGVTGVLVDGRPPSVAVQVAAGAEGRLLVISANDEPGWRATVNGQEVLTVRGWGHQVAVPVSAESSEVRVGRSEVTRNLQLLAQAAVVLLVVGTAIPTWRRRQE